MIVVRGTRSQKLLAIGSVLFVLLVLVSLHPASRERMPEVRGYLSSMSSLGLHQDVTPTPKYAYAAFLGAPMDLKGDDIENDDKDDYYIGTRMLTYSLLHDPVSRTKRNIPLLTLVTEDIPQRKRDRLTKDGATVVEVGKFQSDWITTKTARWRDQLSKLHLFNMTEYDKILFLDSDTVVLRCLDDVFDDPAAQLQENLNDTTKAMEDEGPQPPSYMMAGTGGAGTFNHSWPPHLSSGLNGGFFMVRPSVQMLEHIMLVMTKEGRYPTKYMEQSLLNYVFRKQGNMPWQQLSYKWNINYAIYSDYTNGVASVHAKYWDTEHDMPLRDLLWEMRGKSKGYFNRLDEDLGDDNSKF